MVEMSFDGLMRVVDHYMSGGDVVEIVRCRNCRYWSEGHTEECDNPDSVCFHNGWCKPDWFCADGERR